ncbi:acyl carrier protein [Streptomyces sp. NPDC001093]|uniref:Actinorhodin polyketide synthase acyl carrier protein n=1 Tax=Streptomyces incarnatus TaxID=665007 RepID=A0ABN4GN22_9ACTN|nr:acyl carrier protein [Streptomyces incarnatus]AKJ11926.1 actinorhodin polyketide synthase acyl carrier protein [Streptomyces incarnatus]
MTARELTLDDLTRILRESAGEDEGVDLDGDILDTLFADLGYDSLALLEASSRIEREFGVKLSDDAVSEAETPRLLLAAANGALPPAARAA